MNILFIAPKIPWPPDQGDKVHMFNIMSELSKNHKITFIGCYLKNYQYKEEACVMLGRICADMTFYKIPSEGLIVRTVMKVKSLINLLLFADRWPEFIYNISPFVKLIRRNIKSRKYDLIITNYWYTAYKALSVVSVRKICDTHLVGWEHDLRSIQRYGHDGIKYKFMKRINEKLLLKEAAVLNSFDRIIAISERDAETFRIKLGIKRPIEVIPTIYSERMQYHFNDMDGNNILIYGAMQSKMNRDAVELMVKKIFPEIIKRVPDAKLLIAGSGIDGRIGRYSGLRNIEVLGYVQDLKTLLRKSKILVLPLRSGAGLKGRILEAMEAGLPVVCTSIAAEGLSTVNSGQIVIADSEESIIAEIVALLGDPERRKELSRNARDYFDRTFSWNSTYGKINEVISSL